MRKLFSFLIMAACMVLFLFACKKWVDPPPRADPSLTNPYCNDPNAINYNWGFPGRPDDSICIYPSNVFRGRYVYTDSVFQTSYVSLGFHIDTITIFALSYTKMGVLGLCSAGDTLHITSNLPYQATVDTTIIPLSGSLGQQFCRTVDTVTGTLVRDQIDTTMLHINFTVVSDTGTTLHIGSGVIIH